VLGQKVQGTDPGSIYRVIAVSDRVKIAIRLKNGDGLSIRAEGTPTTEEELKLAKAGFGKAGGEHWSIHFSLNGIPADRALGAFLFGLGIEFESTVTSAKQLGEVCA
jgi:hypothetical protein